MNEAIGGLFQHYSFEVEFAGDVQTAVQLMRDKLDSSRGQSFFRLIVISQLTLIDNFEAVKLI